VYTLRFRGFISADKVATCIESNNGIKLGSLFIRNMRDMDDDLISKLLIDFFQGQTLGLCRLLVNINKVAGLGTDLGK